MRMQVQVLVQEAGVVPMNDFQAGQHQQQQSPYQGQRRRHLSRQTSTGGVRHVVVGVRILRLLALSKAAVSPLSSFLRPLALLVGFACLLHHLGIWAWLDGRALPTKSHAMAEYHMFAKSTLR